LNFKKEKLKKSKFFLGGKDLIVEGKKKEEYNKLVNNKLNEVENNIKEAEKIITKDLSIQKNKFNENLYKKRMRKDMQISPSPINIKRKTIIFPVNDSPSLIFDIEHKCRKSTGQPNSERLIKRLPSLFKTHSYTNKKHSISEMFDDYFKKFHYLYFHTFSEKQCIEVMEKINENYKEKLECFIFFEDQIKELELLTTGDTGNPVLIKIIMSRSRLSII
jgi:hypothetical protein